jgi:hypothetical protein
VSDLCYRGFEHHRLHVLSRPVVLQFLLGSLCFIFIPCHKARHKHLLLLRGG